VIVWTVDDALRRAASTGPERTAVSAGGGEITYAELDRSASALAGGLRDLGVSRGARIAVALTNRIEAALSVYAVCRAGAALVPLPPGIKSQKLGQILADCGAQALICEPSLVPTVRAGDAFRTGLRIVTAGPAEGCTSVADLLRHEPLREQPPIEVDIAAIIYTSGTTGAPKGVTLTHRNMAFAASSIVDYLQMQGDDRVVSVLPLSFDYGLYQLLLCTAVGATLLLEPGVRYPGRLVQLLTEQRVTGLPGVPSLFGMLSSLPGFVGRPLPHLRFLTSTGAVLAAETILALRAAFPRARLYSMYGLTECKRVSYLPPGEVDRRPTSVGVPIPGTQAWIEDESGARLGAGQVGQLMVRGPHVMQGYWDDPVETGRRLRPGAWPWERTLMTGDQFRCDDEGFLYYVGRRDDMIKTRGEKVYPREIEDVLLAAPGVLETAVVGVPDALLGEAIHAHVAPRPGMTLEVRELHRFCSERLETHLVPSRIVVHGQLPKTLNGKIDHRALGGRSTEPSAPETAGSGR
jgi:long-chain acyl-CoA synthetase